MLKMVFTQNSRSLKGIFRAIEKITVQSQDETQVSH